jgi:hypothetical protein
MIGVTNATTVLRVLQYSHAVGKCSHPEGRGQRGLISIDRIAATSAAQEAYQTKFDGSIVEQVF